MFQPLVEHVNDPAAECPTTPVSAAVDLDEGMFRRVVGQDLRSFVGRAIVDNNPAFWQHGLREHRIQRLADIFGLIPSGTDQAVAALEKRYIPRRSGSAN